MKQNSKHNDTQSGENLQLVDKSVREALSTILRIASSMVTTGISGDISEWELPKTTPKKAKLKIIKEADKWNDENRRRANDLKSAFDVLSKELRKQDVEKQKEQLVSFADWLQYNGKWKTPQEQVKSFLNKE